MNQQEAIMSMRRTVHGADFMGVKDFMRWAGVSKATACRKLKGIEKVPSLNKYFIPDIAKHLRE